MAVYVSNGRRCARRPDPPIMATYSVRGERKMRCFDNGCFFTVLVSESEVSAFAGRWPCFGNVRSYWFQFDKRSGDLVDTNRKDGETDDGGIVALCEDAARYGAKRLKINRVER